METVPHVAFHRMKERETSDPPLELWTIYAGPWIHQRTTGGYPERGVRLGESDSLLRQWLKASQMFRA